MSKRKNTSAYVVASFVALLVVSVLGAFQLAGAFSGATKYNIEVWNGDLVESALEDSDNLSGTFSNVRELFVAGLSVGAVIESLVPATDNVIVDNVIVTGDVVSITSGSWHYTAAQVCNSTLVRHEITAGAPASGQNITLPTAAALIADCLPDPGNMKFITFENAGPEADEVLTFVAGSGIDLGKASTSLGGPGAAKILGSQRALVQLMNIDDASVSFDLLKIVDGD